MANIKELIAGIEVELEAANKRELKARREAEVIIATAQQDGRSALTEEEDQRCEQLAEQAELAKSQSESIKSKLSRARKIEAEEEDYDVRMQESKREFKAAPRSSEKHVAEFRIGEEPRTYNKESDPDGKLFLMDVARQFTTGDVRSSDRLRRHMQEERVERPQYLERAGVLTTSMTGLVVPQYLLDMVAPAVANLRPFADICNKHPLPADGMSVNISRITTPSSAGLQASQNTAVSTADMADTLLTVAVQTAAGSSTLSRQAIDRGSGIEDVVFQDMVSRYYSVVDLNLLTQATNGVQNVANNNAKTTPDFPTIYPAIVGAASQVTSALLAFGSASHVIMHPRRWFWLQSQLVSTWPAFAQPGIPDYNKGGTANAQPYNMGMGGVLPCGLTVIADANVPTTTGGTQDEIYVLPWRECHLWETAGAPLFIRAEQPSAANLGVLLVVYGYFAYTFARYANAIQKITGAALAAPAGF